MFLNMLVTENNFDNGKFLFFFFLKQLISSLSDVGQHQSLNLSWFQDPSTI